MPLTDWQIRALCDTRTVGQTYRLPNPLLDPFDRDHLNPYGYDLTLGSEFLVPALSSQESWQVIDPFNPPQFEQQYHDDMIVIPPHHFVLGRSVEYLHMPKDAMGICMGRSTMARVGLLTNVTPLEAGWEGVVTIEISNTNPLPVMVHVGKGIVQVVFFRGEQMPQKDYVQKGGRYQGQRSVTQGKPE